MNSQDKKSSFHFKMQVPILFHKVKETHSTMLCYLSLQVVFDSDQNLVNLQDVSNNVFFNQETKRFQEKEVEKQPFVSVVVPVFNTGKFIEKCLKSLITQTFDNFEVVIVNDATTDNAIELAEKLISGNPKFRIVHNKKNRGLLFARTHGIISANGRFVFNLDSDDELNNDNVLKDIYNFWLENKPDVVHVNAKYMAYGNEQHYGFSSVQRTDIIYQPQVTSYLNSNHLSWGKLIKRVCYLDAYLFIGENTINQHLIYVEDLLQMSALGPFVKSLQGLKIYGVNYYLHGESSMSQKARQMVKHSHDMALTVNALKRSSSSSITSSAAQFAFSEPHQIKNQVSNEVYCTYMRMVNYDLPEKEKCGVCPIHKITDGNGCRKCGKNQISNMSEQCVDCNGIVQNNMCFEFWRIQNGQFKQTVILTNDTEQKFDSHVQVLKVDGFDVTSVGDAIAQALSPVIRIDPTGSLQKTKLDFLSNEIGIQVNTQKAQDMIAQVGVNGFGEWLLQQKSGNFLSFEVKTQGVTLEMAGQSGFVQNGHVVFIAEKLSNVHIFQSGLFLFERSVDNEVKITIDVEPQKGAYCQIDLQKLKMVFNGHKSIVTATLNGEEVFYGDLVNTNVLNLVMSDSKLKNGSKLVLKSETYKQQTQIREIALQEEQITNMAAAYILQIPYVIEVQNEVKHVEEVEAIVQTETVEGAFKKVQKLVLGLSQLVLGIIIGVLIMVALIVVILLVKKYCKKEIKPIGDVELGMEKKGL
uniref:Glycosyl transferase family 2 protein n=1 Tax=Trepomonas sp. PC1 TaxID=1076344 RepID=A0A146K7M3_9EUKA|eukprot:JAP92803.1 Glycosyl transferase family 2 protein [Trepomonas sp. PC1]